MTEHEETHPASSEQGKRKPLIKVPNPVKSLHLFIEELFGHSDYQEFWKEIMDNDPGKKNEK